MKNLIFCLCALFGLLAVGRDVTVAERTGAAIQRAIDAVAAAGGGRVVVPAGTYPSKSLRLRGGVELHLEKDATVFGSSNPLDYAKSHDHYERTGFVQAWDERNVSLTGEGAIEIDGKGFFDTSTADLWGAFFHPWEGPRPELLQMVRCRGIRIEGVRLLNSPLWTVRLDQCEDVAIDGITLVSDQRFINSDGIDFDGCRRVVMRNSKIVTADDCIVLRAVPDRNSSAPVITEDILIENCDLDSTCQTIRVGCPSDDMIRNTVFRNIRSKGQNGIRFDYPLHYVSDGDEGRIVVSNLVFDGFSGDFRGSPLQITVAPGVDIRGVFDVTFRRFDVSGAQPVVFVGNVRSPLVRIRREDFTLNGKRLSDGAVETDCSNAMPFVRAEVKRVKISRPRPDGLALPDQRKSY